MSREQFGAARPKYEYDGIETRVANWARQWLRVCVAAGLTSGIFLGGQADAADAALRGLGTAWCRYAHPVYKNGKRVLWHGAWRGGAGHETRRRRARRKPQVAPKTSASRRNPQPPSRQTGAAIPAAQTLLDPRRPGDLAASRMARDFAASSTTKAPPDAPSSARPRPTGLAKVARDRTWRISPLSRSTPRLSQRRSMIRTGRNARPWSRASSPETLEVIAPRDVKSISDLQGKTVSFGDPDSATANSARLLFSRLGITVNPTYEPLTEGLTALSAGKRGAVRRPRRERSSRAQRLRRRRRIFISSRSHGRRRSSRFMRRRGSRPPTGRTLSPPTIRSRPSPSRWR